MQAMIDEVASQCVAVRLRMLNRAITELDREGSRTQAANLRADLAKAMLEYKQWIDR